MGRSWNWWGGIMGCLLPFLGWGAGVRGDDPPFSEPWIRGAAVEVWAEGSNSVPHVTLRWNPSHFPATALSVRRRPAEGGEWGPATSLAPAATVHADATAVPGMLYEYRIVRNQESPANGVAE